MTCPLTPAQVRALGPQMMPQGCWTKVTGIRPWSKECLPFEQARTYARSLRLRGVREWKVWAKTKSRPPNIPSHPVKKYKEWQSWGDWLGTGNTFGKKSLPFEQAREYARSLKLKGARAWNAWYKTNHPTNIPAHPENAYKEHWAGWGDWLGTGNVVGTNQTPKVVVLSFEEARTYVHGLGLKSFTEWVAWCKSGGRPANIPSQPHKRYKKWAGWGDWLGTGNILGWNGRGKKS
jgi:hypothetical protein